MASVAGGRDSLAARGLGAWRLLVLSVVALMGIVATLVSRQQAEDEARERQRVLATEIGVLVQGTAESTVSVIAGGGGLVSPGGRVDLESFRAYAKDLVDLSPLESLGYEPLVTDEERADFEERLGRPIVDQRDGQLVPASDRPVYFPVLAVYPDDASTRTVLGFDLLADPIRGTAAIDARDSGRTVLTRPVRATSDGAVSYFLVKPLYRAGAPVDTAAERQEAHVGFLTTVYAGANFTESALVNLPSGSHFTLRDGGEVLAASDDEPSGGTTRMLEVAGRSWELVVEDGRHPDHALAWSLAALSVLLVGGLLLFFRRAEAHDEATRRAARVIGRTADVAQALAAAGTVDEVDAVIEDQMPRVLDAKAASLGAVDREHGVLRLGRSTGANPGIRDPAAEIPLDERRPVTEAVRGGEPVLLSTVDEWREHAPDELVAEVIRSGLVSTACLPLEDRFGKVSATLSISWDHEVTFDAPTRDTLRTLTELCEYTLDRARTTDQAAHEATELAHLAGQLASAITVNEVLDIIVDSGSSPVDANATSVGMVDREAGVLRTHHGRGVADDVRRRYTDPSLDAPLAFTEAARTGQLVLLDDHSAFAARYPESARSTASLGLGARAALPMRDSDGNVIGSMVFAWTGARDFHEALVSKLLTIADMAGQAIERTGLSEAEHRLVTTLQDSVLVPLPDSPGLDIAACYLPASQDIGMGGDWYEGIALDDHRYALIVGDVAGHGITAVGDMAQLRSVIGALVRLDTPLDEVFSQATALVQAAARNPTASALLMVIDTASATVSYAAAGHPPPLVRGPEGETVVLAEGRQPILGIPADEAVAAEVPFPVGSVLVAYTDGLIEVRGEAIDVSVEGLRARVAQMGSGLGAKAIADELLQECLGDREPNDDVALVVIRYQGTQLSENRRSSMASHTASS